MLLLYAVIAIAVLILTITHYKVYPFLVFMIVSVLLALAVGMPMDKIVKAFETGNGNKLRHIAIIVGLGTMMAECGGTECTANTLINLFGEKKNIHWAMMVVAIIVGLLVFFEVDFVLHSNRVHRRQTHGQVAAADRLPMVAGLSVVHGLIPPHPGRTARSAGVPRGYRQNDRVWSDRRHSDRDRRGSALALLISRYIKLPDANALADQFVQKHGDTQKKREFPSFGITLFTILLPVILMLVGSWADLFTPKTLPNDLLRFAGQSDIAVLVSFWTFGAKQGFNREQTQKFCGECLAPIAGITLIIGVGGGFVWSGSVRQRYLPANRGDGVAGESVAATARLVRRGADSPRPQFGHGCNDYRVRHRRADRVGGERVMSVRNCWCSLLVRAR